MIRKVKIRVSGRVQGVFFRKSAKKTANEHGILGTVKNLDDGRVEIIAQAEEARLQPFIDWCHKGPIAAKVGHVEVIELTVEVSEFAAFNIL